MGNTFLNLIYFLIFFILIPLSQAGTTFFDNPDDFFIMNSPATGGVIITEEQQTSGGGGCLYKWNCTDWGECLTSGKQIRTCVNIGTCSDTYKTPETEKNCTYTAPEDGEKRDKEEPSLGPEKIILRKIVNKTIIYFIITLLVLFIIFYFKKDYFKKLIKKWSKF